MDEDEKYTDPGEQALFDEDMQSVMDDPLGGYAPPSADEGEDNEDGGDKSADEENEAPSDPDGVNEDNNVHEPSPAAEGSDEAAEAEGGGEEVSGTETSRTNEPAGEDGPENVPDEEKKLVLSEFSYISRKIRELESTINTVALSIEESADTVERVNQNMKAMLDSIQKARSVMENKVSDFQDGTETWGAEINQIAGNVRQACEDSRGFLNEELKREMKRSQEEIIRSTIDRVKGETASILTSRRDDYEELLDQVVTNYKQFCKASAQHQKDLKKGYFEEVHQLQRILYGIIVGEAILFALILFVMKR